MPGNRVRAHPLTSPCALLPANLRCYRIDFFSCLRLASPPNHPTTRTRNCRARGPQSGPVGSEHFPSLVQWCPIRSRPSYSVDQATAFCSSAMYRGRQSIALHSADMWPNQTPMYPRQMVSQPHYVRSHCRQFSPLVRDSWATPQCPECDWQCLLANSEFRTAFVRANESIDRRPLSSKRYCVIWCHREMFAIQVAREKRSASVSARAGSINPNWICLTPIVWSMAISNFQWDSWKHWDNKMKSVTRDRQSHKKKKRIYRFPWKKTVAFSSTSVNLESL